MNHPRYWPAAMEHEPDGDPVCDCPPHDDVTLRYDTGGAPVVVCRRCGGDVTLLAGR